MTTLRKVLLALALLLVAGAFAGWRYVAYQADIGAGFVAKAICGCVFVAGRTPESCVPDLLPAMSRIAFEVDESAHRVRGYATGFASRYAAWDAATGCTLD
jgi:hypothetical protein